MFRTIFTKLNYFLGKLYGKPKSINERHRHRYEINPQYVDQLEKNGMRFVGTDSANERMEIMELDQHPYYVAVQFHPEYLSRPLKPSPPFVGLILSAISETKLYNYLNRGCKMSPREMSDVSSGKHTNERNLKNWQFANTFFLLFDFAEEDEIKPIYTNGLSDLSSLSINGHSSSSDEKS